MTEKQATLDPTLQLLGVTIRTHRKQRGMSQRTLAAVIGLSENYVSQVELGRRNISIKALVHIAAALEIPLMTLLQPLADHAEPYALVQE